MLITPISFLVVHLSNQHYDICIRQPISTTKICYIGCTTETAVEADNSAASKQVVPDEYISHSNLHMSIERASNLGLKIYNHYYLFFIFLSSHCRRVSDLGK